MMSSTHNEQDLETLSALFDGELKGDAARFAMKRLDHDVRWRQAFGNWQMVGDALRGQACVAAPSGFAARVAAAIAAEPAHIEAPASPAMPVPAVAASARRKWMGGAALAASVAMVAMFVARPFSQDSTATPGAASPAPTELAAAASSTTAPLPVTPTAPDAAIEVGAAALAVAEVPRRIGERRSRGQSQRAALRAPKRQVSLPAIAGTGTAISVAAQQQQQSPVDPFRPSHTEVASRPWPRAVLPAASATGSFTASYGSSTLSSPSFYPFEPRLPNTADATPAPNTANDVQP